MAGYLVRKFFRQTLDFDQNLPGSVTRFCHSRASQLHPICGYAAPHI
nr:MAG TPA: hypothetical protein [Caudoviricetes sp.]